MARKKKTPEEVKSSLKKEILALGIEDNPSRTVYQRKYHRGIAPSPNSVLEITGMKWKDIMQELGFNYNVKKNLLNGSKSVAKVSVGVPRGPRLTDAKELKRVQEEALDLMRREKIYTQPKFEQVCKEKLGVSYKTLLRHGCSFSRLMELYNQKYGTNLKTNSRWGKYSNKELIQMVAKYMVENNIKSLTEYNKHRDHNYPGAATLMKRLNLTYKEVNELILIYMG